jgi:hypothetical protein
VPNTTLCNLDSIPMVNDLQDSVGLPRFVTRSEDHYCRGSALRGDDLKLTNLMRSTYSLQNWSRGVAAKYIRK